ncbi:MAG: hypothetical protein K0Q53_297 [Massilibacillus sp.]|nr:hypothetical protein [Massilibacillus sp.]
MLRLIPKIFTIVITCLVFFTSFASARTLAEVQLDYIEGDWYDASNTLYASIHNGYFNSCLIQPLTAAGGPANFSMKIQIQENLGYRHITLNFSNLREGRSEQSNPLFKPFVSIDSVVVHKKNFIVPDNIDQFLYGEWYDNNGNLIATIKDGQFNGANMIFTSFYGVADHFVATIQINDGNKYNYYSIGLSNMKLSIDNLSDRTYNYSLYKN